MILIPCDHNILDPPLTVRDVTSGVDITRSRCRSCGRSLTEWEIIEERQIAGSLGTPAPSRDKEKPAEAEKITYDKFRMSDMWTEFSPFRETAVERCAHAFENLRIKTRREPGRFVTSVRCERCNSDVWEGYTWCETEQEKQADVLSEGRKINL